MPLCRFYGKHELGDPQKQGSIVTFNLLDSNGDYISHTEVSRLASLSNIQIRTGIFCNPGAASKYLGTNLNDWKANMGDNINGGCWENIGILESGKPTGRTCLNNSLFI